MKMKIREAKDSYGLTERIASETAGSVKKETMQHAAKTINAMAWSVAILEPESSSL